MRERTKLCRTPPPPPPPPPPQKKKKKKKKKTKHGLMLQMQRGRRIVPEKLWAQKTFDSISKSEKPLCQVTKSRLICVSVSVPESRSFSGRSWSFGYWRFAFGRGLNLNKTHMLVSGLIFSALSLAVSDFQTRDQPVPDF